ncbi:ribonuclease HI [Sinorhizobium medicae]|nr:ribonuclease HI [Sinorhizobium medicae]
MTAIHDLHDSSYILIHTDGACSGNPGPGGWAATLRRMDGKVPTKIKRISGWSEETTNNRMELEAALEALKLIKNNAGGRPIIVRSESKILVNGMTTWLSNWKQSGWKGSNRKPVKNADLWRALDEVREGKNIQWQWVRGHNGDRYNEEVDGLATEALMMGVVAA